MNITFRQLRIFDAVARHESITKAAEELGLTQPAVSMQIQQLERNVGFPLFERHNRRLYLTSSGREVHPYTGQITHDFSNMEAAIKDIKGYTSGSLSVSVATTANHFATRLLGAFAKKHEKIKVRLHVTNRAELLKQLESSQPDLVIMGEPPPHLDLDSNVLMDNALVVIAWRNHPFLKQKAIKLIDLQNQRFLIREKGSGTLAAVKRHFNRYNLDLPKSLLELTTNEGIKHAVEAELGLGIVSEHTIELELKTNYLKILDVENFPIMRQWYAVTRKGQALSPIAEKFRAFALANAKKFARF